MGNSGGRGMIGFGVRWNAKSLNILIPITGLKCSGRMELIYIENTREYRYL